MSPCYTITKEFISKTNILVILRLGGCVAIIAEKGDERRSFIC
jgi:hypothetical protein